MEFRKDVQGLRGVAALFVIIFHLKPKLLPGLFTGVDMFFVISGFIISLGVYYKLENGDYSITSFYAKRIKRLMPAMFVLIAFIMVAAYFLFLPRDGLQHLKHSLYTLLFGANFFNTYQITKGYFDMQAFKYPLLHMWSLAIEEQFYIVFALLMLVLSYCKNSAKAVISSPFFIILVILTVFSFAFGEIYYSKKNANFVYYMLPSRMGEITLGIIIASLTFKLRNKEYQNAAYLLSSVGLSLILYSIFFISKKGIFPGIHALYPCLGIALIILGGSLNKKNIINRIIANPILTYFGLISYSMYLYHFAIIAILRYWQVTITNHRAIYLFIVIVLFSTMSYFLIEKPIRKLKISNLKVFLLLFIMPMAILILGLIKETHYLKLKQKDWTKYKEFQNIRFSRKDNQGRLLPASNKYYQPDNVWRSGKKEGIGKARVLLAGNSHASQFYPILNTIAKNKGFSFNTILQFGCPVITSDTKGYDQKLWESKCHTYQKLLTKLLPNYEIIIMVHSVVNYNNYKKRNIMENMLKRLGKNGKKIILVADPLIKNNLYPMVCAYSAKYNGFDIKNCFRKFKYQKMKGNIQAQQLAKKYKNVYYYDPYSKNLCPSLKTCYNYDIETKKLLFRDNSHISRYTSFMVAKMELKNSWDKKKKNDNPLLKIPLWLHQMNKN